MQKCKQKKSIIRSKTNTVQVFLLPLLILSDDMELHHGPCFSSPQCSQHFNLQSRLEYHLQKFTCLHVFTCLRCNSSFDREARLDSHLAKSVIGHFVVKTDFISIKELNTLGERGLELILEVMLTLI